MSKTKIEWADYTFNPWWGCVKISPACDNCYAAAFSHRLGREHWGPHATYREFGDKHWREPSAWDRAAAKAGVRKRVFCASMADVFDNAADPGARAMLWNLIRETPNLTWMLLTKRPQNIVTMLPADWDWDNGWPHVWLGATAENQEELTRRNGHLLNAPARVRFISYEPALGPINPIGVDWVIAGGESGPQARPAHPDWFRSVRDQCAAAAVPFFFKQHGEWIEVAPDLRDEDGDHRKVKVGSAEAGEWFVDGDKRNCLLAHDGTPYWYQDKIPADTPCRLMDRVGKKAAGRTLDGREHSEFPT